MLTSGYSQSCVDSTLINLEAICPLIYAPVCGCDGVTYDNNCFAQNYGGVTSWTDGVCTGGGDCVDVSDVDFGSCDMFMGYALTGNMCTGISGCGYVVDEVDYSSSFYQSIEDCNSSCGDVQTGCINQWQIEQGVVVDCVPSLATVCGCDSVNYTNACEAFFYGGVTTYSLGPCSDSSCLVIPDYIDFGLCAMPLGIALTESGCIMKSGCSYIGQNGYDYGTLFFTSMEACSVYCQNVASNCIDPSQIDPNMFCIAIFDPVCGCNDITYSNSCVATYYGGVTSWTSGECGNAVPFRVLTDVNLFPNPVNSQLNISFNSNTPVSIIVRNISGQMMLSKRYNGNRAVVDVSAWSQGIYSVEIAGEIGNAIHKLIMVE